MSENCHVAICCPSSRNFTATYISLSKWKVTRQFNPVTDHSSGVVSVTPYKTRRTPWSVPKKDSLDPLWGIIIFTLHRTHGKALVIKDYVLLLLLQIRIRRLRGTDRRQKKMRTHQFSCKTHTHRYFGRELIPLNATVLNPWKMASQAKTRRNIVLDLYNV